ncbi:hypothetical protein ACH5RR_022720 [Cinchona calisaya]|uniref:Uncharacterized protein n=1 Tax=Cinchona calisaya TaxID=153742 RepID=A0ABD2Z8L7_9GENT
MIGSNSILIEAAAFTIKKINDDSCPTVWDRDKNQAKVVGLEDVLDMIIVNSVVVQYELIGYPPDWNTRSHRRGREPGAQEVAHTTAIGSATTWGVPNIMQQ